MGSGPKWKRELVCEYKLDDINLNNFYDDSLWIRFCYLSVFVAIIKSFAVYIADLWTAVSLLVIGPSTITPAIPTDVSKWIFLACIMISFVLLIWDIIKAYRVLKTKEIAHIFVLATAHRYLSVLDYRYYCLFRSINAKTKGIENYAFFIYFTLKNWKRLLLAEAPRQVINIVTLEALVPQWIHIHKNSITFNNNALGSGTLQKLLTGTMAFSVLVFAFSFISVIIAVVLYIPLLCHIRGNLKEYCCHKIDKRVARLLQKQNCIISEKMRLGMTHVNEAMYPNLSLKFKAGNHDYHEIVQFDPNRPVDSKKYLKDYHNYMPSNYNNIALNQLQPQYTHSIPSQPPYRASYSQKHYPYY